MTEDYSFSTLNLSSKLPSITSWAYSIKQPVDLNIIAIIYLSTSLHILTLIADFPTVEVSWTVELWKQHNEYKDVDVAHVDMDILRVGSAAERRQPGIRID